jgi:hypothetical protein
METARLIRAFVAHRTRLADVSWPHEPDPRQRDSRLSRQTLDDLRQHAADRPLGGNGQRNRLQGLRVHRAPLYNENSMRQNENSLPQRNVVAAAAAPF